MAGLTYENGITMEILHPLTGRQLGVGDMENIVAAHDRLAAENAKQAIVEARSQLRDLEVQLAQHKEVEAARHAELRAAPAPTMLGDAWADEGLADEVYALGLRWLDPRRVVHRCLGTIAQTKAAIKDLQGGPSPDGGPREIRILRRVLADYRNLEQESKNT